MGAKRSEKRRREPELGVLVARPFGSNTFDVISALAGSFLTPFVRHVRELNDTGKRPGLGKWKDKRRSADVPDGDCGHGTEARREAGEGSRNLCSRHWHDNTCRDVIDSFRQLRRD